MKAILCLEWVILEHGGEAASWRECTVDTRTHASRGHVGQERGGELGNSAGPLDTDNTNSIQVRGLFRSWFAIYLRPEEDWILSSRPLSTSGPDPVEGWGAG